MGRLTYEHSLALLPFLVSCSANAAEGSFGIVGAPFLRRLVLSSKNAQVEKAAATSGTSSPKFLQHNSRSLLQTNPDPNNQQMTSLMSCDSAFLECLPHQKCFDCFSTMNKTGVDWASVPPMTPCVDVLSFLNNAGHCKDLKGDSIETDVFCNTFDSCVFWDNAEEKAAGKEKPDDVAINCEELTECKWPGMHLGFLGDGICHEFVDGCYNHEICNFDDGDCCDDTCSENSRMSYFDSCGMDGYACRDPKSANCDPYLSDKCEKQEEAEEKHSALVPECASDETLYRLELYDSWGDGWDNTKLVLTPKDDPKKEIFNGGLIDGAQGTEYICLSTSPACYHAKVGGGIWGNEVSWEIRPATAGTRTVADGGAPQDCEFSVGGEVCLRTCDGKPDAKEISNDSDYQTYKELSNCIFEKCVIQVGACNGDVGCKDCLQEDAPEYCYANENYNAVVDCALCSCMQEKPEYCLDKDAPGTNPIPKQKTSEPAKATVDRCSADDTLRGSNAVVAFSQCTNFDQITMMVTDFDENNFGLLDAFESCSHTFQKEPAHGGKKALDCMNILWTAMTDPGTPVVPDSKVPSDAVSALAELLYKDAEDFCSCAMTASQNCPLCESFVHFKTLLYEVQDACMALDEIDCDAWNDFYDKCKDNLQDKFGAVDFSNSNQCNYITDTCGGVGPFPAFRKLDCGREIPKQAWDLYISYERGCLGGSAGGEAGAAPVPTYTPPARKPPSPSPVATKKPYPGSSSSTEEKKAYYASPDDTDHHSTNSNTPEEYKPKRHRFLWFLSVVAVGGLAYWYRKRRLDSFDFVRYRRQRNYGGGDNDMYSGLAMSDAGAGSFAPPTLPPTPSAMGNLA